MRKSLLLAVGSMAVCAAPPVSAATSVTITGLVTSVTDPFEIFPNDILGEELKLNYIFTTSELPRWVQYTRELWYYDVCGLDCHEFVGYEKYYISGEEVQVGWDTNSWDGRVSAASWVPDNIITTIEVAGITSSFFSDYRNEAFIEYFDNSFEISDMDLQADLFHIDSYNGSFWASAGFYSFNNDAISSVNPADPVSYALAEGDQNWGGFSWIRYIDGGQFRTDISFQPLTFSSVPVGISPAIPEPATWAMLLLGFGAIGAAMRRSRRARVSVAYA